MSSWGRLTLPKTKLVTFETTVGELFSVLDDDVVGGDDLS